MRYLTFRWWSGLQTSEDQDEDVDNLRAYQEHMAQVRDKLPADLLRLEEDVSLHDGWLERLSLDVSKQELLLVVKCSGNGGTATLTYSGVSAFESTPSGEQALPGPGGFGDLGYWEIDLIGGEYEHRFLFSSGIVFRIRFTSFQLQLEP